MIKKLSLIALLLIILSSCVSKKIYTDLEDKYSNLKKENRALSEEVDELTRLKNQLENDLQSTKDDYKNTLANY